MSTPARALKRPASRRLQGQLHFPSVHVRNRNKDGFDYEEDYCVRGAGRQRVAERTIKLAVVVSGAVVTERETTDVLCDDELAELEAAYELFLDEKDPEVREIMEGRARVEYARQQRILHQHETACTACGCSDSRACSGGCVWATRTLCSRCAG